MEETKENAPRILLYSIINNYKITKQKIIHINKKRYFRK